MTMADIPLSQRLDSWIMECEDGVGQSPRGGNGAIWAARFLKVAYAYNGMATVTPVVESKP